jgi:hypothetical protein
MHPQVIEEQRAAGQPFGDRNESDFVFALELDFVQGAGRARPILIVTQNDRFLLDSQERFPQ